MFSQILIAPIILASLTLASTKLSNGTSMQYGRVSPVLMWQSSGLLYQGCDKPTSIQGCYQLKLTSDPTKQLDTGGYPTPRQRIEFRSINCPDNSTWMYSWKHYLSSTVSSTDHFFHLMQLFSTGSDGPVVTFDAANGKATMVDYARPSCPPSGCPSIPLSSYQGRITLHTAVVTYGPNGKLSYVVSELSSGRTLLSYSANGTMGSSGSYMKFGTYRQTWEGMSASNAFAGDFTMQQLS